MHILPDLKKIETLYSVEDGLVVIGVHSPKFDNEKDSANILSAVQRYNITHPVVNDNQSTMWMDLKIRCWPTLVVLGPRANPLFIIMGEGQGDLLEKYVSASLDYYRQQKQISNISLPINLSTDLIMSSSLKFPGKIACLKSENYSEQAELYALSDSGNHRILIINSNGDVLQKIGGKTSGFIDGEFDKARFNSPQGVTFLNEYTIFVADTENHAIRKIDLKTRQVETVIGTGVQGHDRSGGKSGKSQEISSPWDLICYKTRDMDISFHIDESSVPEKNVILIAMAGTHQIWAFFLDDVIWWKYKKYTATSCSAIVGSGREENRNNTYPQNAAFAQPSGLALDKKTKTLFVADSESSCIRKVSLDDGKVFAVAGGDRNPLNLFAYGDVDGKSSVAKFQHPLGVAFNPSENTIYVADTYNHKIKRINGTTCDTISCPIKDVNGVAFQFNEPGGLCLNPSGDCLYVADTNNHTIEKVDLKTMKTKPLKLNFNVTSNKSSIKADHSIKLSPFKVTPYGGGKFKLTITLNFENDVKLTEDVSQQWNVYLPNELYFVDRQNGNLKDGDDKKIDIDITVPKNEVNNEDIISIFIKLNLCSKGACFAKLYVIEIPLIFDENGSDCLIEDLNAFITKNGIRL